MPTTINLWTQGYYLNILEFCCQIDAVKLPNILEYTGIGKNGYWIFVPYTGKYTGIYLNLKVKNEWPLCIVHTIVYSAYTEYYSTVIVYNNFKTTVAQVYPSPLQFGWGEYVV